MTGFGPIGGIKADNSASVDAFARWRTSDPVAIFESQLQYDDQPFFWETVTFGSGSTLFLGDESSLEMTCGTADGDRVVRQTFSYCRYQPGKSQLIICTGVLGALKTNVIKRIGYYDGYDGAFFEQDGEGIGVVLRSSVSGVSIDTVIQQTSWNIDKLDGTGPSSVTIDSTKAQIFIIDLQWLGVGRVRYGIMTDGTIHYCHAITNANTLDNVYMATANLPIRYEIENVGTAVSSTSMKQICCSVLSEGGLEEDKGLDRTVDNGTSGQDISTRASVLSIRPKNLLSGVKNRGQIIPLNISIFTETDSVFFEIIYRGAVTGATWSSVHDDSIAEMSTTSGAVTGGIVVASGYVAAGGPPGQAAATGVGALRFKYLLSSNFDGSAQDEFSVVCTSLNTTATVYASIIFKERF